MKKTGLIDTNQYAHMRKDIRRKLHPADSSQYKTKQNYIQNNSTQKPLQGDVYTKTSFKGFDFKALKTITKPIIKPIPQKLTEKVFESLKNISSTQHETYTQIRNNYINFIKLHTDSPKNETERLLREAAKKYRKKNGITDEMAKNISETQLYYLPQKTVLSNFASQLVAPVSALYKNIKSVFISKNSQTAIIKAQQDKILKEFASFEGLVNSHEIWENGYRKLSGHKKWTPDKKFLIPDDVLYSKINRRRNKVVDPNKGKYSSTSLMLGNRLISGIIYSYFLGTDAYNTTMRYSTDKQEASNQRKSRVAQEFSRIGMNLYVQNLLFGTFENSVNRSLSSAMLVSGSTVAFSEVLGRKLVGKPIVPSNKETLDKLEQEMAEKKGILPAIGRLLTNVKKKTPEQIEIKDEKLFDSANVKEKSYTKNSPNINTFKSFCAQEVKEAKQNKQNQTVSFKGHYTRLKTAINNFYAVEHLFDKQKLTNIIKIVQEADSKTADSLKNSIMKSVEKSQFFKQKGLKCPEKFEDLLNTIEIEKVPVGKDKTIWGSFTTSLLIPFKFVKNIFTRLFQNTKKLLNLSMGRKNNAIANELQKLSNSSLEKDKNTLAKFKEFYEKRSQLEAWAKSALNEKEKELKLFEEFKSIAGKNNEDIQGAKNILLWIDKQIKKENIQIKQDGTFAKSDIDKIKKILRESFLAADGSKHVEYDGNTIAQVNINLSRAITTLFLMTDAYNLTMQYSNDNKKEANKSAKNRAAQEVSRIAVSAYMLAFVHNLLSKLCNSSLAGAFTLTALTSTINDAISREVVGVPLNAKNHDELIKLDEKNAESKNPIKKALAYSIGKKNVAKAMQSGRNTTLQHESRIDYFANDFFIKPEIH